MYFSLNFPVFFFFVSGKEKDTGRLTVFSAAHIGCCIQGQITG